MFGKEEYIKDTLTKDESIKVRAKYHWIAWSYFWLLFLTLGAASLFCFFLSANFYLEADKTNSIIAGVAGVLLGIYPFIVYMRIHLVDMVCTNKRIISKKGVISVKTEELMIEKLESIQIEQTFWGRVLNYGSIFFSGTGTAQVEFDNIYNPLYIKARIEECIEDAKKE